jgi:archaeosine synthase beta-subunit
VSASIDDRRIRSLRPATPAVDPWQAHGAIVDPERRPDGVIEHALTVFLSGAECSFTCSFCDLWRWTFEGPTPAGAIPRQLREVLHTHARDAATPQRLKLYNASNFFDRRAVPVEDLPTIAALAAPFGAVTVESHAHTVGPLALEFRDQLSGRLEVAIGLETIHPLAAPLLNKRLDLPRFERAANFLADNDMDLRVFALLGAPYIAAEESVEWAARTVEYAVGQGAAVVCIIPVRGGNGEMDRLQSIGQFVPPTLRQLETALDSSLAFGSAVVTVDLWDAERLPGCDVCRRARIARLGRMNLSGQLERAVECAECEA